MPGGAGVCRGGDFAVDFQHPLLNDSKQLTEKQRDELRLMVEREALAWCVASATPEEIDRMNILQASYLAMHRAWHPALPASQSILVDGNRLLTPGTPHLCVVKGDGKYASIAAASILAKTYRDAEMYRLATLFPEYDWHSNKGYPTLAHRNAIRQHGLTVHHRRTFQQLPAGRLCLF